MSGYVKIKASEIPFYISLAEEGIKYYSRVKKDAETDCKELKYSLEELNQAFSENYSISYGYKILYATSNYSKINKKLKECEDIKYTLEQAKDKYVYIDSLWLAMLEDNSEAPTSLKA